MQGDVPHLSKLRSGYETRAQMLMRLEEMLASVGALATSAEHVVAVGEAGFDYSLNPGELVRKIQ
ncbi:MAG: hypothetical protein Q4A01_12095 [Coriobacteriales bacterium]|nr:hypothetical protein [Coriobacteriales bacterium]